MVGQENYSISHIINYKHMATYLCWITVPWLLFFFFLRQCLSKSSVAISSFLIPHPAPRSPLPPQALRHVGRTQPPGCSRTGCSTPSTRLCHCLPSQAWSPRPQQNTWPKYPVFKGERVHVGWDWGDRAFGEAQWKPRQTYLRVASPQDSQKLMAKLLLTPLFPSSFPLTCQLWESHFSEYYPTFFVAITLWVSSRLFVLHSKT